MRRGQGLAKGHTVARGSAGVTVVEPRCPEMDLSFCPSDTGRFWGSERRVAGPRSPQGSGDSPGALPAAPAWAAVSQWRLDSGSAERQDSCLFFLQERKGRGWGGDPGS